MGGAAPADKLLFLPSCEQRTEFLISVSQFALLFRTHRMHCTRMWRPIGNRRSACVYALLCLFVTTVSPAKTAERIKTPIGIRTQVGPRNHVLYGGVMCCTNPLTLLRGHTGTCPAVDILKIARLCVTVPTLSAYIAC